VLIGKLFPSILALIFNANFTLRTEAFTTEEELINFCLEHLDNPYKSLPEIEKYNARVGARGCDFRMLQSGGLWLLQLFHFVANTCLHSCRLVVHEMTHTSQACDQWVLLLRKSRLLLIYIP